MRVACLIGLMWVQQPATASDRSDVTTPEEVLGERVQANPIRADWQVRSWSVNDGLPQASVTDIIQTRDGHIWLTTFGGAVRFDGHTFHLLTAANTPGLDAVRFTSLVQAPDDAIWFASEQRGVYRYADGVAVHQGDAASAWDLIVASDGTVWGSSDSGLVQFSSPSPRHYPTATIVRHLVPLDDGAVGAGGYGGTWHCAPEPCTKVDNPPSSRRFTRWFRTPNDNLWAFTQAGATRRDDAGSWRPIGPQEDITFRPGHLFEWDDTQWITHGSQIYSLPNLEEFDLRTLNIGASNRRGISAVWPSDDGTLWIGLDGAGLMRVLRRPMTMYGASDASVYTVAKSPDGSVWFSNQDGVFDTEGAPVTVFGDTSPSRIWNDGYGGVLSRVGKGSPVLRHTSIGTTQVHPSTPGPWPGSEEPHSGPWFTSQNRLYTVAKGQAATLLISPRDLHASTLFPIVATSERDGWLLVDGTRLVELKDGVVARDIAMGRSTDVRDVLSRGRRVWVATYDAGLAVIEGDRVLRWITPAHGMCDYALSHLFDTSDGHVWVNTNQGLGRLHEAELEAAAHAADAQVSCDMISTGEANRASGMVTDDGHLWLPTIAGLAEVDPSQSTSAEAPRISINKAQYGQHDLLTDRGPVSEKAPLGIQYSALYLPNPNSIRYRYRLLGQDDAWSEVTTSRDVQYGNLPPGDYRFEVIARGPSAIWSEPASVRFTRQALWWETTAARTGLPIGAVLLLMSMLAAGMNNVASRNRALQREIHDRERAEKDLLAEQEHTERMQGELEADRRLKALGRLSGGIAHDFNNLLTVVSTHSSLLREHPDAEVSEVAQELMQVVRRGATLTQPLLLFGRHDPRRAGVLDLSRTILDLLPMLRRLIRQDVQIDVIVEGRCGVRIDRGHLDQIITNLVVNARDAIDGPGRVHIILRAHAGPPAKAEIEVRDDGCGIEAKLIPQMFEPYFTSKPLGQGTGLGLSTVHGCVSEADGQIEVHSEVGAGTSICIFFPAVDLSADDTTPALQIDDATVGQTTLSVLIVDDQPDVLRALSRLASKLGWQVYSALTMAEAVTIAAAHPLDVMITDVIMPSGSGPQVRKRVLELQPDLPVLFMTGHEDGLLEGVDADLVLRKPFSREQLIQAVRRVRATDSAER